MDVNQTCCGDHFAKQKNIQSLCFTPETNIMSIMSRGGKSTSLFLKEIINTDEMIKYLRFTAKQSSEGNRE